MAQKISPWKPRAVTDQRPLEKVFSQSQLALTRIKQNAFQMLIWV